MKNLENKIKHMRTEIKLCHYNPHRKPLEMAEITIGLAEQAISKAKRYKNKIKRLENKLKK